MTSENNVEETLENALDKAAVEANGEATAAAVDADSAEGEDRAVDPYKEFKRELRRKPGKWYVIHSYAGYERKVKQNLWHRREIMKATEDIYEVEVPMEEVMEVRNGQRKMVSRVRIPGYVMVRMNLNETTWSVVRHTPGVTGFVGNAQDPIPLRFNEAFEMLKSTVEIDGEGKGEAAARAAAAGNVDIDFERGETITITGGPFAGYPATINEINAAAGKVVVLVAMFDRETAVELGFDQIEKMV
ncbi:transcription termination/antitermination protein NusG [Canibacter zhoujuaniae]|uniref:transcription termination/antitermination protein NusG n=1 Tax=Canibacter zhoujuaniae TaxID=2708343 RepID=UPI001423216D|nr:transcription termination/antitermination protein NusG [Canibacter zhoujuaniae]